ncbi:ATP-dependent helicase [Bosea sp. ANAM02]|uniref:ATP-dependent helicase n=1 Tax=Bosea sp. ANAM02 TaxID=2020412 RepID=UPI001566D0D2|nr:ATP-dependent helicase [Bosea sp. ANAM02]
MVAAVDRESVCALDLFSQHESAKSEPALSEDQAAVVNATEASVIVMAGAGTGKTRTLVARVSHLIAKRGVKPEAITIATFTNKAAKEIRERIAHFLDIGSASRIQMGTFHSLAARILRRHHKTAGLPKHFTIIDDDDALRLIKSCVERHFPEGMPGRADKVDRYISALPTVIRRWKCWGLTVAEIEDAERPRRSEEEERLAQFYVAYQFELDRRGVMDFGDLVVRASALLRDHPEVADVEIGGIGHLLVDEAQDANQAQVELARLLASRGACVMVVGDVDQSIYSFQGGYPEAMDHIAGENARIYPLTINRRCTDEILAPAVKLVGWNRRKFPKSLASGTSGERVQHGLYGGEREEAWAVAARLVELARAGQKYDDIAVLVRSAFVIPTIEEGLLKAKIPYELAGGASLVDREEVRDIAAYMRLAVNPWDDLAFQRIVNRPTRQLGPVAEHALVDQHLATGEPFHEVCARIAANPQGRVVPEAVEALKRLSSLLEALHRSHAHAEEDTASILEFVLRPEGVGYEDFAGKAGNRAAKRRVENLNVLRRIANEEPSPPLFLERLVLGGEIAVERSKRGAVTISTMHASKGLEWDHVLCVGVDSAVVPSPRALREPVRGKAGDRWFGPSAGGMEEERRLVHVAFTRARKSLWVSGASIRNGRAVNPSPFFAESGLTIDSFFDPFVDDKPKAGMRGKGFSRSKPIAPVL